MIVGTAGHIDHGKTSLVRALTGVDTDRLPEERQRGITIELGFAPLRCADGEVISIVDVPGHEGLIHTMVAGASGIDAAILVVAADEGVMPQTVEHLRVLTALNVRAGVVALTKCDLVDQEWLLLVVDDVRSALALSSLANASLIDVSAATGQGIDAVRAALLVLAERVPARRVDDLFRFVVDRAFTVKGTGTVVTGTVWSGTLELGARVTLLPCGSTSRVRAIHSHGARSLSASPGTRYALALADVTPSAVPRGTQIVTDRAWCPTRYICADIQLARGLYGETHGRRRDFMFYLAGTEARARISSVKSSNEHLTSDTSERVRIVLDRPVVARRGDRFVLRSHGVADTVGGGVVVDPMPANGPRGAWDAVATTPGARLRALLDAAGRSGIASDHLTVRLGVATSAVGPTILAADGVSLGSTVYSGEAVELLTNSIATRASEYQAADVLQDGIPLARLREEFGCAADLVDRAVSILCERGKYTLRDGTLFDGNGEYVLSDADAALLARLLHRLSDSGAEPPTTAELTAEFGVRSGTLLRVAERRGNVVAVESVRYYHTGVVTSQIERIRRAMQPGREYSPQELREIIGVSRKYLIPFMEYCDGAGVTERRPSGRAIRAIHWR